MSLSFSFWYNGLALTALYHSFIAGMLYSRQVSQVVFSKVRLISRSMNHERQCQRFLT